MVTLYMIFIHVYSVLYEKKLDWLETDLSQTIVRLESMEHRQGILLVLVFSLRFSSVECIGDLPCEPLNLGRVLGSSQVNNLTLFIRKLLIYKSYL